VILLPYLALDGGGSCVELASNCRTLSYIARSAPPRPAWPWQPVTRGDCPECCCPECDDGTYTFPSDWPVNPAPWADPAVPASWEFFGLLLDSDGIRLEAAWSSRRRGDTTLTRNAWTPRTLTITGTVVSSSARGTAYGEEWLARTLTSACSGGSFTVRVLKHCPNPAGPEFTGWVDQQRTVTYLEPVQWVDPDGGNLVPAQWVSPFGQVWWEPLPRELAPGAGRCDQPADAIPLAPLPSGFVPQFLPDTGWRELRRVRFVSMEDLDDDPMPTCEGKRVAIICEVLDEHAWFVSGDAYTYAVLLDRPWDGCQARPIDWRSEVQVPTVGAALTLVDAPVTITAGYRRPLMEVTAATLTPVLPWSVNAALVAEVFGGIDGCANVALRIHDALDGVPAPDTVLGCAVYGRRSPCAEALISEVPAGATVVLDGRSRRVWLRVPGYPDQPAEHLVTAGDGSPFVHPVLGCGKRSWITASSDAYRYSVDASVRLTYVPFEVS
jgi:hypothetical protein